MKSLMGRLWEEGKISITLRGKKNYNYNGTKMRSSWEVLFAAWLDSNSLEWEYEPKVFFYKDKNGRNRRYLPDFWVPQWGCFVEVKAQWAIDRPDCPALTKKRAVEAAGFPMRFVMNEEIETMKKEVA